MRAGLTLALLLLQGSAATAAPAAMRADLLRTGAGHWTVDAGGPLGPVEVVMQRTPAGWDIRFHGMYPIMDAKGQIQRTANTFTLWLTDETGGHISNLEGTLQHLPGTWNPGTTFDVAFQIRGRVLDDHPALGIHVCVGDETGCVPSANLESRS